MRPPLLRRHRLARMFSEARPLEVGVVCCFYHCRICERLPEASVRISRCIVWRVLCRIYESDAVLVAELVADQKYLKIRGLRVCVGPVLDVHGAEGLDVDP